jgi:hypothetical protein
LPDKTGYRFRILDSFGEYFERAAALTDLTTSVREAFDLAEELSVFDHPLWPDAQRLDLLSGDELLIAIHIRPGTSLDGTVLV